MTKRILIIGAYGNFGSYITKKLAHEPDMQIIIAGRSEEKCRAFAEEFRNTSNPPTWHALDIENDFPQTLKTIAPDIVIHTSGPFQGQGYAVAEACIAQRCHYIDLADGRDFVCSIGALDQKAKEKNVAVISGASSVPCLTSAIIDRYLPEFEKIIAVDYAISTAQRTPPGIATTAAILGYAGRPFKTLINGRMQDVYGWQSLHSHSYPELGRRWLGNCDVPDLSLFPQRYKDLQTIRFYAGLEVPAVHIGLWMLSWLARVGLVRHLEKWAGFLRSTGRIFDIFGSKNSAFYMRLSGLGKDGQSRTSTFYIIARSGDGPFIPCIPSILLTKMLACGELQQRGAFPCMGVISLPQYLEGLAGMDIKAINA
jgi:saccharopine dehydrogenase-like NADP-dependent oxidoreductase